MLWARCLSFICVACYHTTLAVYPPTLGEQPLIVGIHGLATHEAYSRGVLLPSRWALTPPFHPYLPSERTCPSPHKGRRLFSVTLNLAVANNFPLGSAVLCVARTFLPPLAGTAVEPASAAAKVRINSQFTMHNAQLFFSDPAFRNI